METCKNDMLAIMNIDNTINIPTELVIKIFKTYIQKIDCYRDIALLLLNKMLKMIKLPLINDMHKFLVLRTKILEIDGNIFYNNNQDFLNLAYHKQNDFKYNGKSQRKQYIITILHGILKKINKELSSKQKMVYSGGTLSCVTYYYIK